MQQGSSLDELWLLIYHCDVNRKREVNLMVSQMSIEKTAKSMPLISLKFLESLRVSRKKRRACGQLRF